MGWWWLCADNVHPVCLVVSVKLMACCFALYEYLLHPPACVCVFACVRGMYVCVCFQVVAIVLVCLAC